MLRQLSRALPVETGYHQCQPIKSWFPLTTERPRVMVGPGTFCPERGTAKLSGLRLALPRFPKFILQISISGLFFARYFQISRIWSKITHTISWKNDFRPEIWSVFFSKATIDRGPTMDQWNSSMKSGHRSLAVQSNFVKWQLCSIQSQHDTFLKNLTVDLWVWFEVPEIGKKIYRAYTRRVIILYPDNNQEGSGNWKQLMCPKCFKNT